ncbi:MAG TPA: hypothetical protein VMR80_08690 [Candidatus Acidoferrum sp.]|nr:hypothetical protein [Candidatus Acidoferrum sp.]
MTRTHKIEVVVSCILALVFTAGILSVIRWGIQKPIALQGAVLVQDSDPRKQLPVAGVTVSAGDLAMSQAQSDSLGFFTLTLRKPVRRGHALELHLRQPHYQPLDVKDYVTNKLYVLHMIPIANTPVPANRPQSKVANVRVRYTVKSMTHLNVGSAVKTFEIENRGNIPCNGQRPCSPDGRWKAALGSATLDAGVGNEFRDARVSCIAGPCPFTRIESDHYLEGARIFTVAARDWSDSATFLLEAEVFHPMVSQVEHWSYPVIFGEGLSFTLPADAESVSIEADLEGQTIIFPLGPTLALSWAACDSGINPNRSRIYTCTPKPGYRFQ